MSETGQPPGPGQPPAPGATPDPQSPPPGWYSDPGLPGQLRYWDGAVWTQHTAPDPQAPAGWGSPSYQAAERALSPLAPSGLRRVSELFSDLGRILRSAWGSLTLVGILPWLVLGVVMVPVSALLLDFSAWSRPIQSSIDAWDRYGETIPLSVQDQLAREFESAAESMNWGGFAIWVVVLVLLSMLVFTAQMAASYRIGAEAASGRPAGFRVGLSAIFPGAFRILGYSLVLVLGLSLVMAVALGIIIGLGAAVPALAVILSFLFFPVYVVLIYWLMARFQPGLVRAALPGGSGSLGWSWRVTKGRTWAVLGRLLVVTIVVNLVAQTVIGAVFFVMFFAIGLFAAAGSAGMFGAAVGLSTLVVVGLGGIASSATAAAITPIFRDLTDDPVYRSIQDGQVVPVR